MKVPQVRSIPGSGANSGSLIKLSRNSTPKTSKGVQNSQSLTHLVHPAPLLSPLTCPMLLDLQHLNHLRQ